MCKILRKFDINSLYTFPPHLYTVATRLGVLETGVLVSRRVFTSLDLGLGLGTLQSRSRSRDLRQWRLGLRHSWSGMQWHVQSAAAIARKSSVRLPALLLWNGYSATAVCWCGQTGLGWGTTCCHSCFTCDATISCKFSWCCTVVINL